MNLYPYNYYSLYFALGLLAIVLIVTLIKVLIMSKNLKNMNNNTSIIQENISALKNKTQLVNDIKEEKKKKTAWIKTALPIALAIHTIYKKNDNLKGVSGYTKAAKAYVKNTQAEKKIIKRINKALLKK